jgi:hypothetical protein
MWMTTYLGGQPSDIESDLSIPAKAQLQAFRNAPFAINQATHRPFSFARNLHAFFRRVQDKND